MLSSSPFSSYSSPSSPSCSQSGKYVMCCSSAAHITRTPTPSTPLKTPQNTPKMKKKKMKIQEPCTSSSAGEDPVSGAERVRGGFSNKHAHTQTDRHKRSLGNLANPRNTPWYLLRDHRAHKSFSPDQSLIVTGRAYSVFNVFLTKISVNTNAGGRVLFVAYMTKKKPNRFSSLTAGENTMI